MKILDSLHLELANYAYAALGLSLATLIISLIGQKFLPPLIPLFYGQPEGEGQLAPSLALALPGVLSLLIFFLNAGLSLLITDGFLKKTLVTTTLATSIFAAIATLKIIFLVGSF